MGCVVGKPGRVASVTPPKRLMLYSEHAAQTPSFEEALRACGTIHAQFSFEHGTVADLTKQLAALVKQHGAFERVGFAPHGPNHPPSDAASIAEDEPWDCPQWELTKHVVLSDPVQLARENHPANQVLVALGRATIVDGTVDLFSCPLLKGWACPQSAWPRLRGFSQIEEATHCRFAASEHALAGSPLLSEAVWTMDSDESIDLKQTYFLPDDPENTVKGERRSSRRMSQAQVSWAKNRPDLIRISPVLGAYDLGDRLGAGNFAVVRRAMRRTDAESLRDDPEDAEGGIPLSEVEPSRRVPRRPRRGEIPSEVAIKVIDKAKALDLASIKREVGFMVTLVHPNIVRLFEIFEEDRSLYLVCELATGGELFERILSRGTFTEADASRAMREVGSALQHVHEMGIVHRDLKPENLLCATPAPDAPIKVADFGLGAQRLLGGRAELPKLVNSSAWLNKRKSIVGSPIYIAPEVLSAQIYSPACDLWATGVILYFLLAGRPPFFSQDVNAVYAMISANKWDGCNGDVWTAVSDGAKGVVRQLLEPNYRKRLTATKLLAKSWVQGEGVAAAPGQGDFRLEDGGGIERLRKYRESSKRLTAGGRVK